MLPRLAGNAENTAQRRGRQALGVRRWALGVWNGPQRPTPDAQRPLRNAGSGATMQLAIDGGTPVRQKRWPAWPEWDESDVEAVAGVVRSGDWFSMSGTQVKAFGEAFAGFHQARFGAPCANGTQALEIALRA